MGYGTTMKRLLSLLGILLVAGVGYFFYRENAQLTLSHEEIGLSNLLPPSPSPVFQIQEQDVQEISETIFRYCIRQHGSTGIFFLSIDGKDPTNEFMERFSGPLLVKKVSGSHVTDGWLRDRTTGKRAMLLSLGGVRRLGPNVFEVKGGSYCGARCADGGVYRVAKRNGHWLVEQYDIHFES
jgi:hypothetical protein